MPMTTLASRRRALKVQKIIGRLLSNNPDGNDTEPCGRMVEISVVMEKWTRIEWLPFERRKTPVCREW
jgi:hypothetical protein